MVARQPSLEAATSVRPRESGEVGLENSEKQFLKSAEAEEKALPTTQVKKWWIR